MTLLTCVCDIKGRVCDTTVFKWHDVFKKSIDCGNHWCQGSAGVHILVYIINMFICSSALKMCTPVDTKCEYMLSVYMQVYMSVGKCKFVMYILLIRLVYIFVYTVFMYIRHVYYLVLYLINYAP